MYTICILFSSLTRLQKHRVCVTIPRPQDLYRAGTHTPPPLFNGSEIPGSATVSRSLSLNDKSYSGVAGLKRNGVGCHGTCKFYWYIKVCKECISMYIDSLRKWNICIKRLQCRRRRLQIVLYSTAVEGGNKIIYRCKSRVFGPCEALDNYHLTNDFHVCDCHMKNALN